MSDKSEFNGFFPPYGLTVEQFFWLIKENTIYIPALFPNRNSISYFNRMIISDAQGIHLLTVPVKKFRQESRQDVSPEISRHLNWEQIHWNALQTAYGKTAFFEFYEDELKKIIFSKKEFLKELNVLLFEFTLNALGISDVSICKEPGDKKRCFKEFSYVNPFGVLIENPEKLSVLEWLFRYGPVGSRIKAKEIFS
jgi:hypothetical protein